MGITVRRFGGILAGCLASGFFPTAMYWVAYQCDRDGLLSDDARRRWSSAIDGLLLGNLVYALVFLWLVWRWGGGWRWLVIVAMAALLCLAALADFQCGAWVDGTSF